MKLHESRRFLPLLALTLLGSTIAPLSLAQAQDDNPYLPCLRNCDDLSGSARQLCRAECFGDPDGSGAGGDGTPHEGPPINPYPPSPPQPWGPGGGDNKPY